MKSSAYYNHGTPGAAVMRVFEDGKMRIEQDGLILMEIKHLSSMNWTHDFDGQQIEASLYGDPVEGLIEAKALRDVLMPGGLVEVEKVLIKSPSYGWHKSLPFDPLGYRY